MKDAQNKVTRPVPLVLFHYLYSILLALIISASVHAQTPEEKLLAKDPQWLALLHIGRGTNSKIQPSSFFISADGYKNPESELSETIKSLEDPNSQAQCIYPARYEWLASKKEEIRKLPKLSCPALEKWSAAINPSRITLIFASSFVNNPASAFGHTFIRLDQENTEDLLAYSANYAAETKGDDALTYAVRGIFGGYDGFFSVMPYYQKVKEYSDLENRDIWEYGLALKKEEIRRLLLHLWELKKIPASYYYFDENCSYKILELIMVARPDLSPSLKFDTWVIPVDTVRVLGDLIENVKFRPSAQTLLKNRIEQATSSQKSRALELANPDFRFSLENEDAETLDLAYELIIYRKVSGSLSETIANQRAFEILSKRGANPKIDKLSLPTPPSTRPEHGHGSAQISIEAGSKQHHFFTRLSARPAFHDLLDPQPGYQKGSQINFFELALDATESENLNLGYFTALDITSLTPVDEFFSPLSWNVRTGLKRNIIKERDDSLSTFLGASFGKNLSFNDDGLFYALLDSEVRANQHYNSDLNPGAGARVGILTPIKDHLSLNTEVQWLRFFDQTVLNYNAGLSYAIGVKANIIAKLKQENEYDRTNTVATFGFEWFFNPG